MVWGRLAEVEGVSLSLPLQTRPERQGRVVNAPHTGTFENRPEPLSSDQRTPCTSPYFAFPFRFLRMGCSDSAWGWARNELLFELVGLVLCLAAWEVTGCLSGLGGRPQEGAPRKSLTPTAATSTATTAWPFGSHTQV